MTRIRVYDIDESRSFDGEFSNSLVTDRGHVVPRTTGEFAEVPNDELTVIVNGSGEAHPANHFYPGKPDAFLDAYDATMKASPSGTLTDPAFGPWCVPQRNCCLPQVRPCATRSCSSKAGGCGCGGRCGAGTAKMSAAKPGMKLMPRATGKLGGGLGDLYSDYARGNAEKLAAGTFKKVATNYMGWQACADGGPDSGCAFDPKDPKVIYLTKMTSYGGSPPKGYSPGPEPSAVQWTGGAAVPWPGEAPQAAPAAPVYSPPPGASYTPPPAEPYMAPAPAPSAPAPYVPPTYDVQQWVPPAAAPYVAPYIPPAFQSPGQGYTPAPAPLPPPQSGVTLPLLGFVPTLYLAAAAAGVVALVVLRRMRKQKQQEART